MFNSEKQVALKPPVFWILKIFAYKIVLFYILPMGTSILSRATQTPFLTR